MRWVGSRFTGASAADVEHTVIASSGDLAYTVGFERSHVSVDGGPPAATRRPAAEVGSGRPSLPRMPSAGGPLNRMFSQVIGNRAAKDGGTFAASASPVIARRSPTTASRREASRAEGSRTRSRLRNQAVLRRVWVRSSSPEAEDLLREPLHGGHRPRDGSYRGGRPQGGAGQRMIDEGRAKGGMLETCGCAGKGVYLPGSSLEVLKQGRRRKRRPGRHTRCQR